MSRQQPDSATLSAGPRFSRRTLLIGAAGASAMAFAGPVLATWGQADDQITIDTYNGLLAMLIPGDDRYSQHQGVTREGPGGVGAGAVPLVIGTYHESVPINLLSNEVDPNVEIFPSTTLNNVASQVSLYAAVSGPFLSPFANLAFEKKIEVLRRLEEERPLYDGTIIRFLLNTLPTLTTFVAYSEAPVFDPQTRTLTGRPLGWDLTRYPGVAEGRDEFIGYYRGVQSAEGA